MIFWNEKKDDKNSVDFWHRKNSRLCKKMKLDKPFWLIYKINSIFLLFFRETSKALKSHVIWLKEDANWVQDLSEQSMPGFTSMKTVKWTAQLRKPKIPCFGNNSLVKLILWGKIFFLIAQKSCKNRAKIALKSP